MEDLFYFSYRESENLTRKRRNENRSLIEQQKEMVEVLDTCDA
jgi:hypothetical protein